MSFTINYCISHNYLDICTVGAPSILQPVLSTCASYPSGNLPLQCIDIIQVNMMMIRPPGWTLGSLFISRPCWGDSFHYFNQSNATFTNGWKCWKWMPIMRWIVIYILSRCPWFLPWFSLKINSNLILTIILKLSCPSQVSSDIEWTSMTTKIVFRVTGGIHMD